VILSRAEAGEQRRSDHIGRDGFLYFGFDHPAALAYCGFMNFALRFRDLRKKGLAVDEGAIGVGVEKSTARLASNQATSASSTERM
jgi:hypothetical protein